MWGRLVQSGPRGGCRCVLAGGGEGGGSGGLGLAAGQRRRDVGGCVVGALGGTRSDEGASEALYGRYFLALCHEKTRNLDKAIEQWEKIYQKKASFRDVAEKLTQYQEYRTDDHMKDYLTCGKEEFAEICKAVVQGPMGLSLIHISEPTRPY